jgi:hypothetical protein
MFIRKELKKERCVMNMEGRLKKKYSVSDHITPRAPYTHPSPPGGSFRDVSHERVRERFVPREIPHVQNGHAP